MSYVLYDTATNDFSTCDQLEDAIRVVDAELTKQELDGRVVDREREGRWAIYDGYMVRMIWIEAENGSVISFARHQKRTSAQYSPQTASLQKIARSEDSFDEAIPA